MDLEKKTWYSEYRFRFEVWQVKKNKKELYVAVNFVEDGSATKKEKKKKKKSCNLSAVYIFILPSLMP